MRKWVFMTIIIGMFYICTGYIKWFDFDVNLDILKQAYEYDISSQSEGTTPLDFVQLLAYSAAKNWGDFKPSGRCPHMEAVVARINEGEYLHDITAEMDLYKFYLEAFGAVLGGFVGHFELEGEREYGLKVFHPIAKGYHFSHSDDFGNPRNYGYSRPHLGHDFFGSIGTPVIAVECGIVEALGWNRYGGWRIGIRSFCGKRYYYYAHLQKDDPYSQGLKEGQQVQAGDVIGFLGNTGYSYNENVSNIKQPHLHFGMQIIFNEEQKDGNNQIWIDVYALTRFLNQNRMGVANKQRTIKINNFPFE